MPCKPCEERKKAREEALRQTGGSGTSTSPNKSTLLKKAIQVVSDLTETSGEEESARRLAICQSCEYFLPVFHRCKKCSCFMEVKTKLKNFHCPLVPPKW